MASQNDSNKKLPKNPGEVTRQAPAAEMEISMYPDGRGSQTYASYDQSKAKESSFRESWTGMGSYSTDEAHSKGELQTSMKFESRDYNVGGSSRTAEGSTENYTQDTSKTTVEGDASREIGRNDLGAVANQRINTVLAGTVENQAAGSSQATSYVMSEGDIVEERSGNSFRSYEGDNVTTVNKNSVLVVGSGDRATHVQQGNMDTQVKGKIRIKSESDILIDSDTKITLKVGSSTIVIDGSSIKMTSARIDLN